MNWRHGIHPNNYAIGETEKYYSDMSEKGWELVKCGITLSRFQKTEPKKMRYRVEVTTSFTNGKIMINNQTYLDNRMKGAA
jgi:hypothetical protein